jgi:hypothetical protein
VHLNQDGLFGGLRRRESLWVIGLWFASPGRKCDHAEHGNNGKEHFAHKRPPWHRRHGASKINVRRLRPFGYPADHQLTCRDAVLPGNDDRTPPDAIKIP